MLIDSIRKSISAKVHQNFPFEVFLFSFTLEMCNNYLLHNRCVIINIRWVLCFVFQEGNTLSGWTGMAFRRSRVRASLNAACLVICSPNKHCAIRGSQGFLPCVGWGVTASQLYLKSLTTLYVAGCGRLQLGAPHCSTLVALLQVVDNWLHILW